MDVLRTFYRTPMRVYADSDDTVMVQWYKCAPGAVPFPTSHAFGSLVWDGTGQGPFQGPGQFQRETYWIKNVPFPCPGTVPPPDLARFQRGLLASDGPVPACCNGVWLFPTGGGGGGGTGFGGVFRASGGIMVNASASFWFVPCFHYCAAGGIMVNSLGYNFSSTLFSSGGVSINSTGY